MIRVAFVMAGLGQGWLGGVSYYRNLFRALRELPQPRVTPVIVTDPGGDDAQLEPFQPIEVLRTPLVRIGTPWWKVRRACQLWLDRDLPFERFLRGNRIGLLSHSGFLGRRCPIPSLPWIPDFQELDFPEFFSPAEREARSRGLAQACRHATAILVSSEAARTDLARAHPGCGVPVHVLRFVASVPGAGEVPTVEELQQRYRFSAPYFHLPNQFWAHKNHEAVIDAVHALRERGREVLVLATGNTADHRQPGHFAALERRVASLDLGKWFRVLGIVPYRDLMGLMAHSVAVVNPSHFEGWSTTVEEAKSLGKPVVLSDIPVHREQAPAGARYFDPRSPTALADALWEAWEARDPERDRATRARAERDLPGRRQQFARQFEDIVLSLAERLHLLHP